MSQSESGNVASPFEAVVIIASYYLSIMIGLLGVVGLAMAGVALKTSLAMISAGLVGAWLLYRQADQIDSVEWAEKTMIPRKNND